MKAWWDCKKTLKEWITVGWWKEFESELTGVRRSVDRIRDCLIMWGKFEDTRVYLGRMQRRLSMTKVHWRILWGGELEALFQGMNLDIDEMPRHTEHLCYDGHRALNFALQWSIGMKG